jgi:hypothetical protein
VGDRVDAYLGEIMVEAASAAAAVNAGLVYALAIAEAVTATDASSSAVPAVGTIVETATAASAQDATVVAAVPSRSAMIQGVFVNPSTQRQAYVQGGMVNL